MARCSAVCPNAPSAFMTSAVVFPSFVFSSSLKSWSTLVGLVPSNRTRTLIFLFTLGHCERSGGESRNPGETANLLQWDFSKPGLMFRISLQRLRATRRLFGALKFAGEKIVHH